MQKGFYQKIKNPTNATAFNHACEIELESDF